MTERALIQQVLQGDQEACTAMVRQFQEPVFRLAYLMIGDADDAKDIAQETFIRAIRALGTFDLERPLRPWLLSIAANLARNHLTANGRHLAALQRFHQAELISAPPDSQFVWEAVRALEPLDQEIIYLRYFLALPIADAAQTLKIAEGTVKSRQFRALQRLREILQREENP